MSVCTTQHCQGTCESKFMFNIDFCNQLFNVEQKELQERLKSSHTKRQTSGYRIKACVSLTFMFEQKVLEGNFVRMGFLQSPSWLLQQFDFIPHSSSVMCLYVDLLTCFYHNSWFLPLQRLSLCVSVYVGLSDELPYQFGQLVWWPSVCRGECVYSCVSGCIKGALRLIRWSWILKFPVNTVK